MLGDNGGGSSDQCDSGWTSYLQHSSYSCYSHPPSPPCNNNHRDNKSYRVKKMVPRVGIHETNNAGRYSYREVEAEEEDEDEEEGLSMVSDASSGPPHFDLNDVVGDRNNGQYIGSRKCNFEHRCEAKDFGHLDDTASSPLFFSPKKKNTGGGTHNVEEGCSSLESLIDYSNSPALSATHFQKRSRNLQEGYEYFPSPCSADRVQQNQWS